MGWLWVALAHSWGWGGLRTPGSGVPLARVAVYVSGGQGLGLGLVGGGGPCMVGALSVPSGPRPKGLWGRDLLLHSHGVGLVRLWVGAPGHLSVWGALHMNKLKECPSQEYTSTDMETKTSKKKKQPCKEILFLSPQVINFSSTTIAVFIGVVGILSIIAQVPYVCTHINNAFMGILCQQRLLFLF